MTIAQIAIIIIIAIAFTGVAGGIISLVVGFKKNDETWVEIGRNLLLVGGLIMSFCGIVMLVR